MAWAVPNVQRMEYVCGRAGFFSKSASAKLIKDAEVVALKHVETDPRNELKQR